MQAQLIAVDAGALDALTKKVERLEAIMTQGTFQPREEWVGIQEAARVLECSADTIRRKINSGELEAKGSGKSRRVKLD
ncbi:helix-turn-helix domain-containing protein [Leisingera sp.]|uniref:helix-turn-helix domain-containing protein n=1 Tax=Leisingera sp. TaxID=1879318 RepID=UPI002B27C063|nr:helix-turn-helix domain-containing protein [Leisingera sp.]